MKYPWPTMLFCDRNVVIYLWLLWTLPRHNSFTPLSTDFLHFPECPFYSSQRTWLNLFSNCKSLLCVRTYTHNINTLITIIMIVSHHLQEFPENVMHCGQDTAWGRVCVCVCVTDPRTTLVNCSGVCIVNLNNTDTCIPNVLQFLTQTRLTWTHVFEPKVSAR